MANQGREGLLSSYLVNKRINAAKIFLRGKILDFGCGSGSLSKFVSHKDYFGYDIDEESIVMARTKYPGYYFQSTPNIPVHAFDTVICLAVIEHLANPKELLINLTSYLKPSFESRIVLTTPNPSFKNIYHIGAKFGIFSRQADEEHQSFLDKKKFFILANETNLDVVKYKKFLYGANQLVVLRVNQEDKSPKSI